MTKNGALRLDEIQELLAGYVLGDLSPEEHQLLEAILQEYPELQGSIDRLQESLYLLPCGLPPLDPPPQLEQKILAAVQKKAWIGSLPFGVWLKSIKPWLGLLAAAGCILLGLDNIRLRLKPMGVVEILNQPNTRLVSLKGDRAAAPQASGSVLFTAGQWQEVVVTLRDLPQPPPGQVYRLWAKFDDNKVILCGEFDPDPSGRILTRLETYDLPNPGSKLTEVFATLAVPSTPQSPSGPIILIQAV
jgi:hypothetical protein